MLRKEVKRLREKLKGADRKIPFTVDKDMHSKALSRQSKRLVKENQELKDVIVMLARKMHGQESYAELQSAIHDIAIKGKGE